MRGMKFGKWTIISNEPIYIQNLNKYYDGQCQCGLIKKVLLTSLKSGRSTQCASCSYKERFNPEREIGNIYGKWRVIKFVDIHRRLQRYEVICICGTKSLYPVSELRSGKSTQCMMCHNRQVTHYNRKEGKGRVQSKDSYVYSVWSGMMRRCYKIEHVRYKDYGGRGIKVCNRWHIFNNFLEDMGIRPQGLTIERINNDGDYEPGNCRWATYKEQNNNNRRNNVNKLK